MDFITLLHEYGPLGICVWLFMELKKMNLTQNATITALSAKLDILIELMKGNKE